MPSELISKNGQLPRLQISKTNDQHTQIYQHTIVIKNYKVCAGMVNSILTLPEVFAIPPVKNGDYKSVSEWKDDKNLIITLSRSKFPNRPMELILDGVRPHWTSYKCAIRRSDDNDDELDFAEIKFVPATNGNGSQVSGLFKDQLRDDLFVRLTICVSNLVENVVSSSKIEPQPAQISKLFMKDLHSDFRIVCAHMDEEEHHIPVHRNILSTASPYFRAMFQPETSEAQAGHVTLTMVPYKALVELLYCIYHGEHSSNFGSQALDLLFAADFFEMIPLRDHAANFLAQNLTLDNVFKVIHAGLQLNLNKLVRKACEYIKSNVADEEAKSKLTELQKQCPELIVHLIQLM